ncbi:MAG: formamidopyrimidine-DNA glycosylase [Planctomycetes bacterium]|jgi:formamidopyrimidine-DNA glycosylase|nr:formamidopyrimidine-DNA glycosylase [Planctomycetota bacterium]
MPELPEVETVCRLIRPKLVGRTLGVSRVHWQRSLGGLSVRRFSKHVRDARVRRVRRRGKYIVAELEREGSFAGAILVHLRMSGRLHVDPAACDRGPHLRVSVDLDDGKRLNFLDVRKFGRFTFCDDPLEVLRALGPEPLGSEFTPLWLRDQLRSRKRILKPLLLDQSFLAGLGNIYVDEALHAARLHPLQRSNEVSARKSNALREAIRGTLLEAIEREGSSFDTFYRTPEGQPGSYQHQFQVYGRNGRPCRTCGRKISRIVVGQRGTHLCSRCQRSYPPRS